MTSVPFRPFLPANRQPLTLQPLQPPLPRVLPLSSSTHTGGKTEDFISAAKLFYRAKRQVKVPTYLVPATQKVRRRPFFGGGGCRHQPKVNQTKLN